MITVLKFSSKNCPPCRAMMPDWAAFMEEVGTDAAVAFRSLDASKRASQPLCKRYDVQSVPTVLFLDHAGDVLTSFNGQVSLKEMHAELDVARARLALITTGPRIRKPAKSR